MYLNYCFPHKMYLAYMQTVVNGSVMNIPVYSLTLWEIDKVVIKGPLKLVPIFTKVSANYDPCSSSTYKDKKSIQPLLDKYNVTEGDSWVALVDMNPIMCLDRNNSPFDLFDRRGYFSLPQEAAVVLQPLGE